MMKKMKITQQDYIKANRKASRDEEIALHGWPTRQHAIHKSKKVYNRKRMKAGLRDLPFDLHTRSIPVFHRLQIKCEKITHLALCACGGDLRNM